MKHFSTGSKHPRWKIPPGGILLFRGNGSLPASCQGGGIIVRGDGTQDEAIAVHRSMGTVLLMGDQSRPAVIAAHAQLYGVQPQNDVRFRIQFIGVNTPVQLLCGIAASRPKPVPSVSAT